MVQVKLSRVDDLQKSSTLFYDVKRKYAFVISEGVLFYVSDVETAPTGAVEANLEPSFMLVDQIKRA